MFYLDKNAKKFLGKRENITNDIVKRVCVITARNIHLKNHPVENPVVAFNPGLYYDEKEDAIKLYARIVLGYFTYTSAIVEMKIEAGDLFTTSSVFSLNVIGDIKVIPNTLYDIWGTEDPRIFEIEGKKYMVYCGRTVWYFDKEKKDERALPVVAKEDEETGEWKKLAVFRMPGTWRKKVISDKDAFLTKNEKTGKWYLFHRAHVKRNNFYCAYSHLSEKEVEVLRSAEEKEEQDLKEIVIKRSVVPILNEKFEDKIGWGTPPLKIEDKNIFIMHAVDKKSKAYKVFSVAMDQDFKLESVTRSYIMEPREIYEIYGDRPYVVFPTGACCIDNKIVLAYGCGDSAIGIGLIDVDDLLFLLE